MPAPLEILRRSPLARHPSLLAAKVMHRLGRRPRFDFAEPPAGIQWRPRPEWHDKLLEWVKCAGPDSGPYPWTRQFGQDFPEDFLLERCRHGPLDRNDLTGDVKLIWEFSRLQGLFLDAARMPDASREENARRLRVWRDHNRDASGLNWTNAMEVAIRAVNLIAANALSGESLRKQFGESEWNGLIWNHGRAIRARLEARLVSSNHYLADLMGLAIIGAHLDGNREARRWFTFAAREFQSAVIAQTETDGGVYEASLPYHALVTEMALLVAALPGVTLTRRFRERLHTMCGVLVDFRTVGGDVFCIGDDDGGRVLPLDFITPGRGRADLLLDLARTIGIESPARPGPAVYPRSGWVRLSRGPWTLAAEFGGVGLIGRGGHAHNDTLSFCLNHAGREFLIDPGSYLYTPDPEARLLFRSVRMHSTFAVEGEDHHPRQHDAARDLFRMRGPRQPGDLKVAGSRIDMRFGLTARDVELKRCIELDDVGVIVTDTMEGPGELPMAWFFHLAPGLQVRIEGNSVYGIHADGTAFRVQAPGGMDLSIEPAWRSPFYGSRVETTLIIGRLKVEPGRAIVWRITQEDAS